MSNRADREAAGTERVVSVVVPVYNAQDYVEEAVRSAVRLPRVREVIVVEDGSTDGSLRVCRALAAGSDRVILLRHPDGENRGHAASRNLGIGRASGMYVAFLDADDWYLPNRFDVDVPLMDADDAVDGVYGAVETRRETEHVPASGARPDVTTIEGEVAPDELFRTLLCENRGWFCTDGITVRRRAFHRAGLFDEELRYGEDTSLYLRMAATCRLVPGSVEEPVAVRRRHAGNVSTPTNPLWSEAICDCLSAVLRWAKQRELGVEKVRLLRGRLLSVILHSRLEGSSRLSRGARVLRRIIRHGGLHPELFGLLLLRATRKAGRLIKGR